MNRWDEGWDSEGWDSMADVWQAEAALPRDAAQIRRALRKRFRRTLLVIGSELLVTLGLVWFTVWWIRNLPPDAFLLVGLWLFWALGTGFTWWNRAGQWRLSATTTHEYVRTSLERARRKVRMAWFVGVFTVAEAIFIVVARLRAPESIASPPTSRASYLAVLVIVATFLGWAAWYHRRAKSEVEYFENLSGLPEPGDPVA